MYDFMLDENAIAVRDEMREVVRTEVDPDYTRRMDRDEITYPRELFETFAEHAAERGSYRDFELDAMHAGDSETIYDDDDMWRVYESGS